MLENGEYKNLKINFAHFGAQTKKRALIFKDNSWQKKIIEYFEKYSNIYTDIACCGISRDYYTKLNKNMCENNCIKNKILFGSDYMINLLSIENYINYLKEFSNAEFTNPELKDKMCNINPEKFLNVK